MSPPTPLRRSLRTPKPRVFFEAQVPSVQKATRSAITKTICLTKAREFTASLDSPENTDANGSIRTPPRTSLVATHLVDDMADGTSSDSEEEDPDSEEHSDGSIYNLHYQSADVLDRRDSLDSRLGPGNEEYDFDDGFIVADDYLSEEEMEDAGSDITILGDDDGDEDMEDSDSTIVVDESDSEHQAIEYNSKEQRKLSASSTRSSNSGLFVSDLDDPPESIEGYYPIDEVVLDIIHTEAEAYTSMPVCDADPEDIVEEINDAISFFARRCHMDRAPLRLRLGQTALQGSGLMEAIERACQLNLAQVVSLGDGTEGLRVGRL